MVSGQAELSPGGRLGERGGEQKITCIPATQEPEAGGSRVQGQPGKLREALSQNTKDWDAGPGWSAPGIHAQYRKRK